jgi:hypothetical protein
VVGPRWVYYHGWEILAGPAGFFSVRNTVGEYGWNPHGFFRVSEILCLNPLVFFSEFALGRFGCSPLGLKGNASERISKCSLARRG